jgi:diguanylate cyclase (GGDEF)-like protein
MPKIMIVDDEDAIRENLELGLKAKGFETVSAANGEDAVSCALRNSPDLILLDVMMPKLDGLSVCKRLKALMGGFVPIIMVTAMGSTPDKAAAAEHGADDYMVKPFKIEELLARITALLRIKSKHDDLKKESVTDFVTGVYNHRYLCSRLREESLKAVRSGAPLSCLMVDLDNFKSVNDKHGHQFGDRVLKKIADFLTSFTSNADIVARYGGDEFVLLLSGCPIEGGTGLAEQIRTGLQKHEFVENGEKMELTCSIGVASFPGKDLNDVDDLLKAMDKVLYASKKKGRNKVTVFEGH